MSQIWRFRISFALTLGLITVVVLSAVACSGGGQTAKNGSVVKVVAAENFWGSIASQVGGSNVQVTSIITDPNADPHSYDPTTEDARTVAGAQYVIYNGAGYDPWMGKLLSGSPSSTRKVLNIGDFLGKKVGDNPHMWYNPDYVMSVAGKIRDDLKAINPANAGTLDQSEQQFIDVGLKQYKDLIAQIKSKYSGTPVGASESIFSYMAPALGLDLITPVSYLNSVSEGEDITAADQATVETQVNQKQIKILAYNSQNTPPNVQTLLNLAKQNSIPVTTITETLDPANDSFQRWQVRELQGIADALKLATGK